MENCKELPKNFSPVDLDNFNAKNEKHKKFQQVQ